MFVDSMDCFLSYNLSCVNGTFAQFNTSSIIFGDVLDPNLLAIGDHSNNELITSTSHPISSSILVSLQHCIITALILGGIILSTITGNILVIAAVILEKSLHSVAYYLFVSLAVADIMVASMVSHSFVFFVLTAKAQGHREKSWFLNVDFIMMVANR
jgi:hypothetical protein